MKASDLKVKIDNFSVELGKAMDAYREKHKMEPCINELNEEEGLILCSGIKRSLGCREFKLPYMKFTKFKHFAKTIKEVME